MERSKNKKALKCIPNKIFVLPDSVLYHILSFLDMKEVVGTSLVSRRWRNLWASVPVLNFDHDLWDKVNNLRKEGFMNFVDKVLFLRDDSKVSKFQIFCSTFCDSARLVAWLTVAGRRRFQEVQLGFNANGPLELPHLLFTSPITLFKLHAINGYDEYYYPIKVPKSVSSSPQLKTLTLEVIQLPEGNLNGELMLSCPVLENLTLFECDQLHLNGLIISAPRLKNLVIENTGPEWIGACHIKIWTPNLMSLSSIGFWYRKYSLMNYSSLVDAKIDFPHEQLDTHNLVELLGAVACATTIELSFVDYIYKLDKLTNQFSNLRRLKLVINGDKKLCISVVLQLLKNAPCIETLLLDAHELEDYEEEVVSFKCSHLKSIEIGRLKGSELRFLEFLLKNAVVLEKFRIKMCVDSSVDVKDDLSVKVLSLRPRTSTSTAIVIV